MIKSNWLIALSLAMSTLAATASSIALLDVTGVLDIGKTSSTTFDVQARNYLLDHPEILLESIQRLDEKNKAAENNEIATALRENKTELLQSQFSPVVGNLNGDVTLVEFFDYNCPYCRKAVPIIAEALKTDSGLRVVYKEWPILGRGSEFAARAALASRAQGKYDVYHHALMANPGTVDEAATLQIAQSVGLDVERLKRDMETPEIKAELERNFALAEKLRITGTPAFIIGEDVIRGLVDLATLQQAISGARQKSGD
jgi:protein-disulfide isomerase